MIADYLRDGFGPRRSPKQVLTVAQVREIFVSTKEARVLADENGVGVQMIRRIWERSRWGQFTSDLDRPKTQTLDCSVYVDEPLDESDDEAPKIVQLESPHGSLIWRLSPSGRIALAEIRPLGEATRVVPVATYDRYRRLLTEARGRGAAVEFEGRGFERWLGVRIREEAARQAIA